jgi:hypothetical protein
MTEYDFSDTRKSCQHSHPSCDKCLVEEAKIHQMPGDPAFTIYLCLQCNEPVPMSRVHVNPEYCSQECEEKGPDPRVIAL